MGNRTWIVVGVIILAAAAVGLALAAGGLGKSQVGLQGSAWEWAALEESAPPSQQVVPDPAKYTITFNADGSFDAKADCNLAAGTYTADGGQIHIVLGPTTLAECGPESLYNTYLAKLAVVDTFALQGDTLVLGFGSGAGELTFRSK